MFFQGFVLWGIVFLVIVLLPSEIVKGIVSLTKQISHDRMENVSAAVLYGSQGLVLFCRSFVV